MESARTSACLAKSMSAWDPTHPFETSWLLGPSKLFACRLLMTIYLWILSIWGCVRAARMDVSTTNSISECVQLWPWGLTLYLSFATIHTLRYRLGRDSLLDQSHPKSRAGHSFSYTIAIVSFVEVPIRYVAYVVAKESLVFSFRALDSFSQWQAISACGINTIFGLFEILLPRTAPMPFGHLGLIMLIQGVGLIVSYTALSKKAVTHELALKITAPIIVFVLVWFIIYVRKRLTDGNKDDGSCNSEDHSSQDWSQDLKSQV